MSAPSSTEVIIATSRAYITRRPISQILFVPVDRLGNIVACSFILALIVQPLVSKFTPVLFLGVALTIGVAWHMLQASRRVPWIPGIIATMACLQWIIAPWLVYLLEGSVPVLPMPLDAGTYFGYFVPAAFALVLGLYIPLFGAGSLARPWRVTALTPRTAATLRTMFDAMLFGGIAVRVFVEPFAPGSVRYIVALVSHLVYVGVFGRVLLGAGGWWWRLALALGVEFVINAIDAQFADALIWMMLSALTLVYRFRMRALFVLGLGVAGCVVLLAINGFKGSFRDTIREQGVDEGDRPGLAVAGVATYATSPDRLLSMQNLALNISRLNEGWVAGRVLVWVPYREPYARGETIITALKATLVPRFIDPDKAVAGGRDNVPRFAGLTLNGPTSMNLSIPGEMYANYGYLGGLFGTFVLALFLGFVFRVFVHWGRVTPLAYAWAPYLLFGALSAEMGIFEVIGTLVKTAVIAGAVIMGTRAWRSVLPPSGRRTRSFRTSSVSV